MKKDQKKLISPVCRLKSPVQRYQEPIEEAPQIEIVSKDFINTNYNSKFSELEKLNNVTIDDQIKFIISEKTFKVGAKSKYISDFLFAEMHKWFINSFIFVSSGTGTGKTTFIENLVKTRHYKICILTNRIANKLQIEHHLKSESDSVKIMSYQELEENTCLPNNHLDEFDFIVLDEAHYFLQDSQFNSFTNCSYQKILHTKKAIKILLSATNERIMKKILNDLLELEICTQKDLYYAFFNYNMEYNKSNISKIIEFNTFDDLLSIIDRSRSKWLIFVKSVKQGLDIETSCNLYLKEKNIFFLCRDHLDTGHKLSIDNFNFLIQNEYFEHDILIGTSIIDNGINLVDRNIGSVIIFDNDYVELMQMLGRKRCIDKNDKFDLYIPNDSKKSISGSINALCKNLSYYSQAEAKIQKSNYVNQSFIRNGTKNNCLRDCIYINPFSKKIEINELGYLQIHIKFYLLRYLEACGHPFIEKKKWVLSKLETKPEIIDLRNEIFINSIADIINKKILKEQEKVFRKRVSNAFMEVYGKESASEKKNRPFTIVTLNDKFASKGLPIEVIKDNTSLIIQYLVV